eukprot:364175-Chlamydomonas_euryale.AAC.13
MLLPAGEVIELFDPAIQSSALPYVTHTCALTSPVKLKEMVRLPAAGCESCRDPGLMAGNGVGKLVGASVDGGHRLWFSGEAF